MYGLLTDLERAFRANNRRWSTEPSLGGWPRLSHRDTDTALVFALELPGFSESDVQVTLEHGQLTVAGKRQTSAPPGRRALRLERGDFSFSQSFALGVPVDAEKTVAVFKNGVLTVTVPKAEARARQVPITVASA